MSEGIDKDVEGTVNPAGENTAGEAGVPEAFVEKYYYSLKTKGFYPLSSMPDYETAGSKPDDLVEIDAETYNALFNPPEGKYMVFDENGPSLQDIPEPDYALQAQAQQQSLLDEATASIAVWQTKLLMGRKLTDDETVSLNAWMDYIDVLNDTDLSEAPDVNWPTKPQ